MFSIASILSQPFFNVIDVIVDLLKWVVPETNTKHTSTILYISKALSAIFWLGVFYAIYQVIKHNRWNRICHLL
jgi:hypothetical protein